MHRKLAPIAGHHRSISLRQGGRPWRRRVLAGAATCLWVFALTHLGLVNGQPMAHEACQPFLEEVTQLGEFGDIMVRYDVLVPVDSLLSASAWWDRVRAEVYARSLQLLEGVDVSTVRVGQEERSAAGWVSYARRAMDDASEAGWTSCAHEESYGNPEGDLYDSVSVCRGEAGAVGVASAWALDLFGFTWTVVSTAPNDVVVVAWSREAMLDGGLEGDARWIKAAAVGRLRVLELHETVRVVDDPIWAQAMPEATCFSVTARVTAAAD